MVDAGCTLRNQRFVGSEVDRADADDNERWSIEKDALGGFQFGMDATDGADFGCVDRAREGAVIGAERSRSRMSSLASRRLCGADSRTYCEVHEQLRAQAALRSTKAAGERG